MLDLSINGDIADYLQLNLDIIDDSSNSESGLSVKLRALANQCRLQKVKVTNPDDGKDYWITEDGIVCSETDQDGLFSLLYGPVEVDGLQYASIEMEHFGVDGAVAVSVKDKQLFAQFDDDIHFGVGNFTAGGLPPSPLLDGLIAATLGDILQGMINQSLTEFVLPFTLTGTETGVSFAFEPQAFEVYTSQNQSAETSWFLYYTVLLQLDQTSLDNANFPEAVPSILGSTFTTDDLAKPNKTDNRHNFAIAINANFVNQFLAMLYRAGFFHQTLFNQTLYTGPGATNALGAIDDNRITIEPSAPAVVVEPTTTSSSSIQVQWPNLLISEARKDENGWQTELQARANLKASIRFEIEERSLVIGLA
ncbi:MAG: hypothetical protein GY763_05060, partial [Gammaproteobacteria bacterium]|nr:hypothetical protein [Gammaproteobacteria bacterium]